jgi:hypothetical protein
VVNEVALAIMDDCKKRLAEIGVNEVLISAFSEGTGAGYSYNGNPKTLAYLANTALLEILFESYQRPPEVNVSGD